MGTGGSHPLDMPTIHQIVEIAAADAGGYPKEKTGLSTSGYAVEGMGIHLFTASPSVALLLQPLYTDQGGNVAHPAQAFGHLGRQKMAIGEQLEIGVGMTLQQAEQPFIEKRLSA